MEAIKNAKISQMIIEEMNRGADIRAAIDTVLGAGTWSRIVEETYEGLRARHVASGGVLSHN